MSGSIRIHMVHVPGGRIISQGTDGLSQGDFTEGVMSGACMLQFVPLNRSAVDCQPQLLDWVTQWAPTLNFIHLQPDDWFDRGQGVLPGVRDIHGMWCPVEMRGGCFLWTPPPQPS
jgi:hypothetical protein